MKFKWELISGSENTQQHTYRSKVIGGWALKTVILDEDFGSACSVTFIPDQNHEWKVDY